MKQNEKWQVRTIARALGHRNFRLFFMGQSVSLVGTWMQRVAVGWLVYRLTDSAFLLGVVGFSAQIPAFVLAPFAGVLADRWNRHRLLILTQVLAMVQAFILAYLVLTETVVIWEIIVLSLVLGVVTAFDIPVRQSFMIEMIEEKADLGNAIALNSSMVNGARLLGPSVAGLLIATVGEGMCFLINGLSYLAVIASLLLMRIVQKNFRAQSRAWHDLKEGLTYVYRFEPIRAIILLLALMSLMGMPYIVLMPVFARDVLHGGPSALGFLMGGSGVGALAGALYLASRRGVLGLGKMIPIGAGCLRSWTYLFCSFTQLYLVVNTADRRGLRPNDSVGHEQHPLANYGGRRQAGESHGLLHSRICRDVASRQFAGRRIGKRDWRTVDSIYRWSRLPGRRWSLCPQAPAIERAGPSNLCHKRNSSRDCYRNPECDRRISAQEITGTFITSAIFLSLKRIQINL